MAEPPTLDLTDRHLAILRQLLARHVPEAEVWAYGSRVTGHAQPGSDLDLVVHQSGAPDQPCPGLPALRRALQQSRLPMLVDVHDWAFLPADFREEICRCKVRLA